MKKKEEEEEDFIPLTESEMEEFKKVVWEGCDMGEYSEAEAANMILYQAYIDGRIED